MADNPKDPKDGMFSELMKESTETPQRRRIAKSREPDEKEVIEPIREVQAIYVDSFFVSVTPSITRITFAELTNENEACWRSAVVLPTSDATELARIIFELVDKGEKANAAAKSEDK
jgi:hypothetical protein